MQICLSAPQAGMRTQFLQAISSYAKRPPNLSQIATYTTSRDPSFVIPNALSLASVFRSPSMGSQLHAQALKLGLSSDTFTMNKLLLVYSKCRVLGRALDLFDEMPHRNEVSWTAVISGSMQSGEPGTGFRLFLGMTRSGFGPNEFALASALSGCPCPADVKLGISLHGMALKAGLDRNPYVGSSLLLMYAKGGDVGAAELAFACVGFKDVGCWNAMVEGYVLNGHGYDATRAVVLMHWSGLAADQFTYIAAVKACLITGGSDFGRQLHCRIIQSMFKSDVSVMNSLVGLYFRAGMKGTAMAVFSRMQHKDTVSWNTAISGFAQAGDEREALGCFADMSLSGLKPNHVTLSVMLRLSAAKENASLGLQFFSLAYRCGYSGEVLVANAVINMLSWCGLINSAHCFFCNLTVRNVVTWNEMISGYGLHGCSNESLRLFSELLRVGIGPDEFTYSAVLAAVHGAEGPRNHEQIHARILKHGFMSCQFVSTSLIKAYAAASASAETSLEVIADAGELDLVSWGVVMSAFLNHGHDDEALLLFNSMRGAGGTRPDEFILATVLSACANAALISQCRCAHSLIIKTGHEAHFCVASAIVDAYAKCGGVGCARDAFDGVPGGGDAVLYNTMITAYANYGMANAALGLYEEMTRARLAPTPATYVVVISACSHLGLVEDGRHLLDSMLSVHGTSPTRANYACIVDLLARRGLLDEAKTVVESMPFQPWPRVWRTLLNGCRIHGNEEMGVVAAERLLEMSPGDDGGYVALSNVYAGDGKWELAETARRRMAENQVQKVHGCSLIEVQSC